MKTDFKLSKFLQALYFLDSMSSDDWNCFTGMVWYPDDPNVDAFEPSAEKTAEIKAFFRGHGIDLEHMASCPECKAALSGEYEKFIAFFEHIVVNKEDVVEDAGSIVKSAEETLKRESPVLYARRFMEWTPEESRVTPAQWLGVPEPPHNSDVCLKCGIQPSGALPGSYACLCQQHNQEFEDWRDIPLMKRRAEFLIAHGYKVERARKVVSDLRCEEHPYTDWGPASASVAPPASTPVQPPQPVPQPAPRITGPLTVRMDKAREYTVELQRNFEGLPIYPRDDPTFQFGPDAAAAVLIPVLLRHGSRVCGVLIRECGWPRETVYRTRRELIAAGRLDRNGQLILHRGADDDTNGGTRG